MAIFFLRIGRLAALACRILGSCGRAIVLFTLSVGCGCLCSRVGAAAPTVEQRLTDLEAYFKNAAPESSLVGYPGPGHNGWMMTSAALVLFMTLPGLALFYGGLVCRKNVLSVVAQCVGLMGIVTVLWWICGYSLCFAKGGEIFGGLDYAFLKGVGPAPNVAYGAWVSHNIYAIYQLMFAIITPGLIVGAIAERMKYKAIMLFWPPQQNLWVGGGSGSFPRL